MKNIIFIAPPAAGKGTISDMLVKGYNYVHLSTGNLLRDEIKKNTEFGREIDKIISRGELVSDDVMIKLVYEKLQSFTKDIRFILDGFPRTLNQAYKLDEMFENLGIHNNMVVYLDISLEDALKRVLSRIVCSNCKRSYNLENDELKPKEDNICDDCGEALEKRNDDTEDTYRVRFTSYLDNVSSIIDYYKEKGIFESFKATDHPKDNLKNIVGRALND